MTRDEALAAAERVLSLVNSQPRTPTKEQVAEAIGYQHEWGTMVCLTLEQLQARKAEAWGPWQGLSRLKPHEIQSEEF